MLGIRTGIIWEHTVPLAAFDLGAGRDKAVICQLLCPPHFWRCPRGTRSRVLGRCVAYVGVIL